MVSMFALYSPNVLAANAVTAQEAKKVRDEILFLQNTLSQTLQEYVDVLFGAKSGSGNLSLGWSVDMPGEVSGEAEIALKNYTYHQNGTDQEQSGTISVKGKYDAGFFGKWSVDMSSFFSFIAKDQDIYVLLKDVAAKTNMVWIDQKYIDEKIKQLNQLFLSDTYIKISPEITAEEQVISDVLKKASLRKIIGNMFDEPLLQAYTKSGNTYALVPTKHACNLLLWMNTYGPLWFSNGYTCGQYEYETFVKEFLKLGTTTITLDANMSTWKFHAQGAVESDISVSYNKNGLQKISYIVTPDQKKYPNDGASFFYEKWKEIKFDLRDATNGSVIFQGTLGTTNRMTAFDLSVKNEKGNERLTLKLDNHTISGKMNVPLSNYDWKESKYVVSHRLIGVFSWKTNSQDTLEALSMQVASIELDEKKPTLLVSTNYNSGKYTFLVRGYDKYSGDFSWKWSGQIEKKYFTHTSQMKIFDEWTLDLLANIDTRGNTENFALEGTFRAPNKTHIQGYLKYIGTNSDTTKEIKAPAKFTDFNEDDFYELLDF